MGEEHQEQIYQYLDRLRESGATNMFGAGPYLEAEFDFTPKEAKHWLVQWMASFSDRHPRGVE